MYLRGEAHAAYTYFQNIYYTRIMKIHENNNGIRLFLSNRGIKMEFSTF